MSSWCSSQQLTSCSDCKHTQPIRTKHKSSQYHQTASESFPNKKKKNNNKGNHQRKVTNARSNQNKSSSCRLFSPRTQEACGGEADMAAWDAGHGGGDLGQVWAADGWILTSINPRIMTETQLSVCRSILRARKWCHMFERHKTTTSCGFRETGSQFDDRETSNTAIFPPIWKGTSQLT